MTNTTNPIMRSADAAFLREVEIQRRLMDITLQARVIADGCGLSRREIASAMGLSSPSTVQRLIAGGIAYNATLESLMRFAEACGQSVHFEFVAKGAGWFPSQADSPEEGVSLDSPTRSMRLLPRFKRMPTHEWSLSQASEKADDAANQNLSLAV